ncbi:signal peptidase II [Candidatus Woesearchaeota archaeon]|jgi:signal peptidase II|nr:signal peptidase II [Candidatus Woesearchaeota archaeon]MBT5739602.1 signal peptidase II [Candidatus Woesearchaeota archaeon]
MVRKMDLGSIRHFWNKKSKDFFVRKRYPVIFGGIVAEVVLLDQLTKWLIISLQPQWHTRFVSINYIQNTGAGFGILQGQTLTLAILSIIIGIVLIGSYNKIDKKLMPQLLFALFLGGLIGNLIDRLFRKFVIDFINFSFWPAFNLADTALTIAAIGLIIYYWKK